MSDDAKAVTDEAPPVHSTGVLAAAIDAAEQAKSSNEQPKSSDEQAISSDVQAASAHVGGGDEGSGRLASLVPTLGRFATRAQKASAPYLSYAALASQEAARCVCVCVPRLRSCTRQLRARPLSA